VSSKLLLDIELVPQSSWLNNVRSALTTKRWDIIRKQVYDQAWNVCRICGGTGPKHPVECHEIWQYDDKNMIQKLAGMIALCPDCHRVKHFGLAQIQHRGERALKHFMKVNKLSKQKALAHITAAFAAWEKRSAQTWKLDLSILSEYGIDISNITHQ